MATFQKGNPGKPKGTRNKATRDIKELIQSTVDFKDLTAKLVLKAQSGEKWAFEMLYEYGYGKPVAIQIAPVNVQTQEGKPVEHQHTHTLAPGSVDVLAQLAAKFAKR